MPGTLIFVSDVALEAGNGHFASVIANEIAGNKYRTGARDAVTLDRSGLIREVLGATDFITDGKARWGSDDVWITQDLRLKPRRRRRGYKIEVKTGIAGSQPQRCLFVSDR
jgi:hypothetical protein